MSFLFKESLSAMSFLFKESRNAMSFLFKESHAFYSRNHTQCNVLFIQGITLSAMPFLVKESLSAMSFLFKESQILCSLCKYKCLECDVMSFLFEESHVATLLLLTQQCERESGLYCLSVWYIAMLRTRKNNTSIKALEISCSLFSTNEMNNGLGRQRIA